jgi:hypothetical protein
MFNPDGAMAFGGQSGNPLIEGLEPEEAAPGMMGGEAMNAMIQDRGEMEDYFGGNSGNPRIQEGRPEMEGMMEDQFLGGLQMSDNAQLFNQFLAGQPDRVMGRNTEADVEEDYATNM